MEQTLAHSTLEQDNDLLAVVAEITEMTDEYCYGSHGVSEVLAGHNLDDLMRVANDTNSLSGVYGSIRKESLQFMQLLVPRFETLYPNEHEDPDVYKAGVISEAAQAVEMAAQVVIAAKIFEKVSAEIDGPTGLSDATCDKLASYNPNNQKVVIDMSHRLYNKNIDDHKSGKDARIIQHNGEAFGHIGGDLCVDVADEKGITKTISLDEYKILLLMKDRRDLKKQLAKQFDADLNATLRAVEDIPVHAYQQRFDEVVEPTRLGKSLTHIGRVGNGIHVASSHAVRAAIKNSQNVKVDHKKVAAKIALVGITGSFGVSVVSPARAEAAAPRFGTSVATAYRLPANALAPSLLSEVDGGLVVQATPAPQLSAIKHNSQTEIDDGIVVSASATLALPVNPQPIHNILPIQNKSIQEAVTNAAANGNIKDGALALANVSAAQPAEVSVATPVYATIDHIDTALAKSIAVPQEIVGTIRNMLIVATASLINPDVLNTVSAEEWNVIQGGQDSAETQSAISELTAKHVALIAQENSGLSPDMTTDQKQQLAELLASSEYYAANNLAPTPPSDQPPAPAVPKAAPVTRSPAPKTHEHSSGLPESAKLVTPEVVHKMLPNASRRTIDKNYSLIMEALASRGIADPKMVIYAFATINVETSTFKPVPEWGRGEGRYRTPTGDYYGRGFIQLTWEANYRGAGNAIGVDLIHNPDLALNPEVAAKIFAWFLTAGNHEQRIRDALNVGDLGAARAVVNGGTNGLQGFSNAYNKGLEVFQAPAPAPAPAPDPQPAPASITPDPAAVSITPPEISVVPVDNGDGLVVGAQPSQQTPDGTGNPAAPIDTPPTDSTPTPQPPVDNPAAETPPTDPVTAQTPNNTPETAAPVSVEVQRNNEIANLKASGQFNQSQASADAPRSPLEKTFQQQGEENGKLKDVVELGPQWPGRELSQPAADSFRKLNDAFKSQFGHDIVLNDAYRNYDDQVAVKQDATDKGRPQMAATPGFSKHGWGLAIDMGGGMQSFDSPESQWMEANALNSGWNHPAFAAPDTTAPEPWHWEYVLSQ